MSNNAGEHSSSIEEEEEVDKGASVRDNPNMSENEEEASRPEVRDTVRHLIEDPVDEPLSQHDEGDQDDEMITVSAATRRIAFAYERFRNTLEPDEEDILRRRAIQRILERRLPEDRPAQVLAKQLLQELIRANYIGPVQMSFAKHLGKRLGRIRDIAAALEVDMHDWYYQLAAVAVDRELYPREQEETLATLMYEDTRQRAAWTDNLVEPEHRDIQLYIACHRALFNADDSEITYHYFLHQFPDWLDEAPQVATTAVVARSLPEFYGSIVSALHHPARERLVRLLRPVAVPYRIMRDLLDKEETDLFDSDEQLDQAIRSAVVKRLRSVRSRMTRRAWNSILFLFLTKTILAFLIEVPYEVFILRDFHLFALIANVTMHPLILLALATTARLPGAANTEKIVEEVGTIVRGQTLKTVVLRPSRHYGPVVWTVFALLYIVLFLVFFWALFGILGLLKFSLVAMFFFVMFLGLVMFLAVRIRHSISDIRVVQKSESALSAIVTFLSLPVLEFGRWLALRIREYNIPLIFMDRVLEAPFKLLIDIFEEWFSFVRERKEEIV